MVYKIIAIVALVATLGTQECGACGGSIDEMHVIPNDAHTEMVAVCDGCYEVWKETE